VEILPEILEKPLTLLEYSATYMGQTTFPVHIAHISQMSSRLNLTFAEKFKEYRKRSIINGKRLSGEFLSALLTERITFVSKSVVYNWENGQTNGILEERKIQIGVLQIFIEGRGMACDREEIDRFLRLGRFISLDEDEWQNFLQKYQPFIPAHPKGSQQNIPHPAAPFMPTIVLELEAEQIQTQIGLVQPEIFPAVSAQSRKELGGIRWFQYVFIFCWFISPFTAHQSRLPITETATLGRDTGKQISQRAFEWANLSAENPQPQTAIPNLSPSAFISRIWNTALTSKELNTYLFENSTRISIMDIQTGDVIVVENETQPEIQVIVFHRWLQMLQQFEGFVFNSGSQKISLLSHQVYFTQDGFTIQNQDLLNADPIQWAYRSNQIPGYVNLISEPKLNTSVPTIGEFITVQFSIRNNGGQPVTLLALTAGARGASHSEPTWASTNVDFPTVFQITLQPGEHYTYKQSRAFYATGNYFAEPVKNQGTWSSLPIQQRGTSILGWNRVTFAVLP